MKRLLKEPLVHFLVLGAGLFVAYHLTPKSRSPGEPGKIVVTQGEIEHLASGFTRSWQRPPTSEELAGLLRDRVREEVYCREAIAMGLDKDDTIIRRRLRQKLEFVSEDIAAMAPPTDAQLEAYLRAHADTFRVPQRFTFSQVYLNPQLHGDGEHLRRDAGQLLAQLNQAGGKADLSATGDAFLLDREFEGMALGEVAKQFGEEFAAQLSKIAVGKWQGPIESGYGMHLVQVRKCTQESLPVLAEVRYAVRREWENARRLEENERFYQELLKRYTVTIEGMEPPQKQKQLAEVRR
jgi:hypothetical protein